MKKVLIFSYKGCLGANTFDINVPHAREGCNLLLQTKDVSITSEAKELLKKAPRNISKKDAIHVSHDYISIPGVKGWHFLGDVALTPDSNTKALAHLEVIEAEVPKQFIQFVESL